MDNFFINPVDALVLIAVLLSGLLALMRGLVREVLSLVSWLIAIYLGINLASSAKGFFLQYTDSEMIASGLGGFAIFFIALVILTIASHYIAKTVRDSALSAVDRSLGFVFGVLRGFLVAALVYLGGTLIFTDKDEYPTWLTNARTEPALRASAGWLQTMMPKELRDDLDTSAKSAKETARQTKDAADTLDRLQTPVPGRVDNGKGKQPSALDEKTNQQLNELIKRQQPQSSGSDNGDQAAPAQNQ